MDLRVLADIIRLGRPHFLVGGFLLYTFGALLATLSDAVFTFDRFFLCYAVLFFAHLSVSYSNEYFDFQTDGYNKRTLFSGGSGVLQKNPELRTLSRWFAILLILASIMLSIVSLILFQLPLEFLLLVLSGNFLGWYYSAPPLRFSYKGLGELSTSTAAGFFMPGMGYFVFKGGFDMHFLALSIPLLLYGMVFILSVEIPDVEGDKIGGKKTWITQNGRTFGFWAIALLSLTATIHLFLIGCSIMALFSLMPLVSGILSLLKKTDSMAVCMVSSLILFLASTNLYLLSLTLDWV
ncbi:MAG: prenyltransferase [Candidatus Altiarchaeota archaeon]|nr:prenyltransferase [Candidatus Altiarchaeota archaeon]